MILCIVVEIGSYIIDVCDSFFVEFYYENLFCVDGIYLNEVGYIVMLCKFI